MKKKSIEDFLPVRCHMVISKKMDMAGRNPVMISISDGEEIGFEAYEKQMTYIALKGRISLFFKSEENITLFPLESVSVPAHMLVGIRCREDAHFLMMEGESGCTDKGSV